MIIKGLLKDELAKVLAAQNLPKYRISQIYSWLYQKQACSWDDMSDLPKNLRQQLQNMFALGCLPIISSVAAKDGTVKHVMELTDGQTIECVYLPETERQTVCFSTQAGCGMGCTFCATGQSGLARNLTTAEIVEQPLAVSRLTGIRMTNLVAMGQGEPLVNYEEVFRAIRIMNDSEGMGIGARHITVSTCGLIPGILRMAEEGLQVNLAVSLHAASDSLRNQLMPINRQFPLKPLMAACQEYIEKTHRRVTFEYVLIKGVNDRPQDLTDLIRYLAGALCHVNLIPLNSVSNSEFQRSSPTKIREFADGLEHAGIETTIRKERGSNLAAACGQLTGGARKQDDLV